jgi:hypothetical protein
MTDDQMTAEVWTDAEYHSRKAIGATLRTTPVQPPANGDASESAEMDFGDKANPARP